MNEFIRSALGGQVGEAADISEKNTESIIALHPAQAKTQDQ